MWRSERGLTQYGSIRNGRAEFEVKPPAILQTAARRHSVESKSLWHPILLKTGVFRYEI